MLRHRFKRGNPGKVCQGSLLVFNEFRAPRHQPKEQDVTIPLPPLILGPIYSSVPNEQVHVTNVLADSEVVVYFAPPNGMPSAVGYATASQIGGDVWVSLNKTLSPKQTITATQNNSGNTSLPSNPVVVLEMPKQLPPPVFLTPLSTCMGSLCLGGLIQGCTLHVTSNGHHLLEDLVTRPISSVQSFALSSSVTIPVGAVLKAWQVFEGAPGETATSAPVVASPTTLPKPKISLPVWPCQTWIDLTNLTPGAELMVFNPGPHGTETLFSNSFKGLALGLVAPLEEGALTAQQAFTRCPNIPPSPIASVHVPRSLPLPIPEATYAPFTNYPQLFVAGVVPGETLAVYRVVEGQQPPELLGEQPVMSNPATVNLPPPNPTDPSGAPVSLLITGTLCDNTEASATLGAPVLPPANLGGNTQYVFWGGLRDNKPVPLRDLIVTIKVKEAIVVSPTSGVTPATPKPLPIGFQINGYPPNEDQTPGDKKVGWMQFAVRMWPGTNTLQAVAEYWTPAIETNTPNPPHYFDVPNAPNTPVPAVSLPNNLTIPAGWTIHFKFTQTDNGTITGFDCWVTDDDGATVVPQDLGINFLRGQRLTAGGPIVLDDLSRMVAFQVVLVGFWNKAQATLLSGAGTITCAASTPLTPTNSWPSDSVGNFGTDENANSTYGLVPAGPSTSITQTFGVSL
jgi:hypothetical protein